MILWFVHNHVPQSLEGFFRIVTLSGSARFLVPVSVLVVIALLVARRGFEALLMAASMVTAPLLVYALKSAFERARPALWGGGLVLGLQLSEWPHPGHGGFWICRSAVCGANLATAAWPGQAAGWSRHSVDGFGCAVAPCSRRALADRCAGLHGPGCPYPLILEPHV